MKDSFDKAVGFVLSHEGGYSNDPKDPGGETNHGISKRAYPKLDIKNLTREDAIEIYRREYWDKINGDELPSGLDLICFDTAVNAGVSRALSFKELSIDANDYILKRISFYAVIVRKNPKLGKFLSGWVNRCMDLYNEVS
jgi:lysozyme family protein